LTSLAGVERIPTLERVDVRDNQLTDPIEIARLTGVPDSITEVYVHRNPFCKAYPNYRVTIFNLFRKTPGYTQDILIDAAGPSSSEKKLLVDRAPELPSLAIRKPAPEEDEEPPPKVPPKVIIPIDNIASTGPTPRRTKSHHRSKSELTGSQRRKKAPKRRVVELSQSEVPQVESEPRLTVTENPFASIPHTAEAPSTSDPAVEVVSEGPPRFEEPQSDAVVGDPAKKDVGDEATAKPSSETTHQQLAPLDTTQAKQEQPTNIAEFDVSSDLYKKKIEALRQDFGNNWLSALGDESWDTTSITSFPERDYTSPVIKPTIPRSPSQGIVSGGRTLG
jgi:hypothetical protein